MPTYQAVNHSDCPHSHGENGVGIGASCNAPIGVAARTRWVLLRDGGPEPAASHYATSFCAKVADCIWLSPLCEAKPVLSRTRCVRALDYIVSSRGVCDSCGVAIAPGSTVPCWYDSDHPEAARADVRFVAPRPARQLAVSLASFLGFAVVVAAATRQCGFTREAVDAARLGQRCCTQWREVRAML